MLPASKDFTALLSSHESSEEVEYNVDIVSADICCLSPLSLDVWQESLQETHQSNLHQHSEGLGCCGDDSSGRGQCSVSPVMKTGVDLSL